jgi:hypothetical protein
VHIDILFTYENCCYCLVIVKINISHKFICLTPVKYYILLTRLVSLIYLEIMFGRKLWSWLFVSQLGILFIYIFRFFYKNVLAVYDLVYCSV